MFDYQCVAVWLTLFGFYSSTSLLFLGFRESTPLWCLVFTIVLGCKQATFPGADIEGKHNLRSLALKCVRGCEVGVEVEGLVRRSDTRLAIMLLPPQMFLQLQSQFPHQTCADMCSWGI